MKLPYPVDPDPKDIVVAALKVRQPIGDIYLCSIDSKTLQKITFFDVRRVLEEDRDVEAYLGIQRPLNSFRVDELKKYVNFGDATFPTSIILAIDDSDFVEFDEENKELKLSNTKIGEDEPKIAIANLCRVIDGQHRIAGLEAFKGASFDVMVALFVGIDISDQGYIFATVNLEQTKVRKSLAFDLFELAQSRSPYKTCHNVAVALDSVVESPFYRRIKRLGTGRDGNKNETITQSTFVDALCRYISGDPKVDRDIILRGQKLPLVGGDTLQKLCLRNLFIEEQDLLIASLVQNYFEAVKKRWPQAWDSFEVGNMLNKTNGFRALMSIFGKVYTSIAKPSNVVEVKQFLDVFKLSSLQDKDFTVAEFPPGGAGEGKLRKKLLEDLFKLG